MAESSGLRIGMAGPVSLDLIDYPRGRPSDLPGGYPAPIVAHFVNALLRRGHSVVVFTGSRGLERPMVIDQGSLIVCVAPRYRPRAVLSFYARERRWLRSLIREHPCDLIHAMWSYEYALAALQSRSPVVVHYHDHAWTIVKHVRDTYRLLRWPLNNFVTRRARNRVANSLYLKQAFGRRGRDMEVIPNFLPNHVMERVASAPGERSERMVTVSNGFHGHKNVARALETWPLLKGKGLVSEYRLVGHGMGPGEEAESYAMERDLAEGVVFVGAVSFEEALEEIRSSTLLLHPSLEESFGMTILEAMAAGTPVVAGRSSGNVPELLGQGACGYLCDVDDPHDIERAVTDALTHKDTTAVKVTQALEQVRQRYSEDRVMEQLEQYYARVLRQARLTAGRAGA